MKVTTRYIKDKKRKNEKITMLTAYDYPFARMLDESGVDMLLVGDSLGMVILGYESTIPVKIEDMIHHIAAVSKGVKRALIVGDMPFMSYHISTEEALRNAARLMQEGGANAVKLEGGREIAHTVAKLVESGIPVMGHVGLTPQSINQLGGFRTQGRNLQEALRIIEDAIAIEKAGAFAIVLECIPSQLAQLITEKLSIPTIGIGAGDGCDGQVQVINDILGMCPDFVPKHTKHYAKLGDIVRSAVKQYIQEVENCAFPTIENTTSLDPEILNTLKEKMNSKDS